MNLFHCTHCDAQFQKWTGRCLECGKWGTVEEQTTQASGTNSAKDKKGEILPIQTQKLTDIQKTSVQRMKTNINELDRVLGGGIVPGSLILLGGEPGIGKSTLSLQLGQHVTHTLYISGEESVGQVKLRADRLGITNQKLELANHANVEAICATMKKNKPALTIVDSIQTISSHEVNGEPGNVNQIRVCTTKLLEVAKQYNIAVCIIGHVTKDGTVAGPKTLEHLVDTVLYLEGDPHHDVRILRTIKNRFGSTDEVGIFEMQEKGLIELKNPSAIFLEERAEHSPGSVITCLIEGTRPLLVEVQALVNKTNFGYPVRKASGFDLNRLHVLTAVLQKRAGLQLGQYDIHVNVVGGLKASEPAVDLAVCLAIASSYKDKALSKDLVVFGEVGLGGEVRSVSQTTKRIHECERLGMTKIIAAKNKSIATKGNIKGMFVKSIEELIKHT